MSVQPDSEAGWPSRQAPPNPITGRSGSEFIGHRLAQHDDQSTLTAHGNKVQQGRSPHVPPIGSAYDNPKPDAVNPVGTTSPLFYPADGGRQKNER